MKNFKKITSIAMAMVVATSAMLLASCGSKTAQNNGNQTDGSSQSKVESQLDNNKQFKIGIAQFGPHPSLNNCRTGFIEGLKQAGFEVGKNLTIIDKNANFDMSTANLVANNLVSEKVNLMCAIATPMALAALNSAYESNIPVVYSAVSDPKASELTEGNITGTSDKLPVEPQLKMIRSMLPNAKNIGILYTTSESNSVSTIKEYKRLAPKYGFNIVEKGITQGSEIALAMDSIVGTVDCITNLTDNTVVGGLPTVLDKANSAKIPVFGSEIEQVKAGCVAADGIDYIALGKQTGAIAAKILKGEATASEIPFEEISKSYLYINKAEAAKFNITIAKDLDKRATYVTTNSK